MGTVGRQDCRPTLRCPHVPRPQARHRRVRRAARGGPVHPARRRLRRRDPSFRRAGARRAPGPRPGRPHPCHAARDRPGRGRRTAGRRGVGQAVAHAAREQPRALCRVRRPAVLPPHRVDHQHRGRRARAGGHRHPDPRHPPGHCRRDDRRPRPGRDPAPGRRAQPHRAGGHRNGRSSPQPPGRSPRCGCCGTRSRACRCPPASASATPRRACRPGAVRRARPARRAPRPPPTTPRWAGCSARSGWPSSTGPTGAARPPCR